MGAAAPRLVSTPTALASYAGPTPWVPRVAVVRVCDSSRDACATSGSFCADADRAVNVQGLQESFFPLFDTQR
jgi:hypothetical protein